MPSSYSLLSRPGRLVLFFCLLGGCTASEATSGDSGLGADAAGDASASGHDSGSGVDAGGDAANDASSTDAGGTADAGSDAGVVLPARVLAFATDGRASSFESIAPFTVRASATLDGDVTSAQCRGTRCLVVHADPTNTVDLIDGETLAVLHTFALAAGSDPRDAAFVDDDTAVVSRWSLATVLELNLTTYATTPIDLAALADVDGLPEAGMISVCGTRAYVQLARIDHDTTAPSALGGALAVLDFSVPGRVIDVDTNAAGTQGVLLANRAAFDMPVDCAAELLYVAEPKPLFQGGGGYEVVNLATLVPSVYDIASSAEVGGFEVVSSTLAWRITHTDFGPGASSHLELVGAGPYDTYNTFSGQHVNDLALDREDDLLFFPDPCIVTPSNQACAPGVHPFRAHTGEPVTAKPIALGFEPIEIVMAR